MEFITTASATAVSGSLRIIASTPVWTALPCRKSSPLRPAMRLPVDVRSAVFRDDRLLLVRERSDGADYARWLGRRGRYSFGSG